MVEKGSLALPEQLEAGKQWTTEVKLNNPVFGTQTVSTTYTYVGTREVDGATMDVFQPTLTMDFGQGGGPGGAKIDITAQNSTGEILFNRSAGRLESSSIDMQMDMTISVNGQEIQQKIAQQVRMKHVGAEQLAEEAAAEQAPPAETPAE
jgi:hypothetical protein